jgi:putative oxidoreductase
VREAASPLAALVLRLALGSIMTAHGWMKVHNGMHAHLLFVQSLGMPGWLAYVSAWAEFGGGILVLGGLLTRIASLFILVNMLVAIFKVHLHNGLISHPGKTGYEYALALAAMALALALLGAGPIALDWLFGGQRNERRREALR